MWRGRPGNPHPPQGGESTDANQFRLSSQPKETNMLKFEIRAGTWRVGNDPKYRLSYRSEAAKSSQEGGAS
jgi:hypothetical protein